MALLWRCMYSQRIIRQIDYAFNFLTGNMDPRIQPSLETKQQQQKNIFFVLKLIAMIFVPQVFPVNYTEFKFNLFSIKYE